MHALPVHTHEPLMSYGGTLQCDILTATTAAKLSMYAGVLALGIGDSMAAVAGKLMGRFRWPGMH